MPRPRSTETTEVSVYIEKETARAWLVSDGKTKGFVPKSQISDSSGVIEVGETVEITIPLWLAEEMGFF